MRRPPLIPPKGNRPPRIPSKDNRPSPPTFKGPPSTTSYSELPSLTRWQNDTKAGRVNVRANDPVLRTIDDLMEGLRSAADGAYLYLLGQLFFTTMAWLNQYKRDARMAAECRKPILSLNLFAANDLARVLECPLNQLASKLQELYGVEMSEHGVNTDIKENVAKNYLTRVVNKVMLRERFRLFIILGRACHYIQFEKKFRPLVKGVYSGTREGYGFVLSMSNVMYVAKLETGISTYHSYFTGGRPVQCAGTIAFDNGKVVYLCNDSGHYKPTDPSMVKVLQYLRMNGMDLRKIVVEREKSGGQVNGDIFLKDNGNWDAILARAEHQSRL